MWEEEEEEKEEEEEEEVVVDVSGRGEGLCRAAVVEMSRPSVVEVE
jgi:hypothetical protein